MSRYFVTVDIELEADSDQAVEDIINGLYQDHMEVLNIAYENIDEEEEDF